MKHFSELSQSAERIVDAAENLVQQFGFNGFSFEDIAQLVGIRKPSIYHHFPSKQELVAVMTQRYTHRFCARLEDINAKYNGAVERLHAHAALFSETLGKEGRLCACGMLGAEHNSLPEPIRQQVKDFFACNIAWLEEVILAGQKRGHLAETKPAVSLAQLWLSALEGSLLVGRTCQAPTPASIASALLASWQR